MQNPTRWAESVNSLRVRANSVTMSEADIQMPPNRVLFCSAATRLRADFQREFQVYIKAISTLVAETMTPENRATFLTCLRQAEKIS